MDDILPEPEHAEGTPVFPEQLTNHFSSCSKEFNTAIRFTYTVFCKYGTLLNKLPNRASEITLAIGNLAKSGNIDVSKAYEQLDQAAKGLSIFFSKQGTKTVDQSNVLYELSQKINGRISKKTTFILSENTIIDLAKEIDPKIDQRNLRKFLAGQRKKILPVTSLPPGMMEKVNRILSDVFDQIVLIAGKYDLVPSKEARRMFLVGAVVALTTVFPATVNTRRMSLNARQYIMNSNVNNLAMELEVPQELLWEFGPYLDAVWNLPEGKYKTFLNENLIAHIALFCQAGISLEEAIKQIKAYGKMIAPSCDPKICCEDGFPIDLIIRDVSLPLAAACIEKGGMSIEEIIKRDLFMKQRGNEPNMALWGDKYPDRQLTQFIVHEPSATLNLIDPCFEYKMLTQLRKNLITPPDDRECTVVIAPLEDWNGAFRNYFLALFKKHNRPSSAQDAGERMLLTQPMFEDRILDILDQAIALQNGKLIKKFYICGHGDGEGVFFVRGEGKRRKEGCFDITDKSHLMIEVAKRLAPGANVYILSCSGGVEGGPADIFSKVAAKEKGVSVFGYSKDGGVYFTAKGNMRWSRGMKIIRYIGGEAKNK